MKPGVLFLFRGPQTNIRHEVGSRLSLLSREFRGLAVAPGYEEQSIAIGEFSVWSPVFSRANSFVSLLGYVRQILRRARGWEAGNAARIDLIVTSDPLRIGLIGWLLCLLLKARLVVEVNGDYAHPANYEDIASPFRRRLKRRLFVSLEKFILGRADGVKLLYPWQVDNIGMNLRNKTTTSFFDFVDLTPFGNIAESKTVLLAGFPFAVKGVDILIDAFRRVADRHPEWQLQILGFYPDPTELEAAMDGHPGIVHLKPIPHSEMPAKMGRCGIYVSASRTEGVPRVLLEAMWSGKPRIVSDVGGCRTLVEDGVDGYLFESEGTERLAELLDRLMGEPELRKALGEAAERRARAEFSPEVYLEKTREFYISILGR